MTKLRSKPFFDLVANILATKKKDPQADTCELETKFDHMVYKLYGLTKEEIAIVENTRIKCF